MKKRYMALIGFAVLVAIGVAVEPPEKIDDSSVAANIEAADATVNEPEINMTEFTNIQPGMSQTEVLKIIGGAGELISENEIAGIRTSMYQWDGNSFGGNANITFQAGKVVSKAQSGLR